MGVLNAGIGGNRVLSEAAVPAGVDVRAVGAGINALARFERHVLVAAGRDARHRAGRHQRHRQRAAEPDADAPKISSPRTSS